MERRMKEIVYLGLVLMVALAGRLYYVQILCAEALSEGARSQQVIEIQSDGARGAIYDRNMIRLTEHSLSYYYLIPESRDTEELKVLMKTIDGHEAGYKGEDYTVYQSKVYNRAVSEKLVSEYDAYAFSRGSRYDDNQTAAHLIGYVSGGDKTGEAGLEKMFQYRLAASPASLSMLGNGAGEPVKGSGITEKQRKKGLEPFGLVTTIDSGLQQYVERILKEEAVTGAAVVMDAKNGQILAMASAPSFNPNRIEDYLDAGRGELTNKAVQGQYPPGSVFKIVVAAAALESGRVTAERTFDCDGSVEINGVKLICEGHPDGHGAMTFEEAFAKSCNGFFARLAVETGSENIVDMAQRMGLGKAVLEGFPGEETGQFPAKEDRAYSGLANLAVGQGSLLVTPLQIARMTNIIASGGMDFSAAVVMSEESRRAEGTRVMTQVTAMEVGKMMEAVCETGTASGADFPVKTAGKTGSAESADNGAYTVHGWFTGYFPAEEPAYTVTVLCENGKTGSGSALPVFEKIVNFLY